MRNVCFDSTLDIFVSTIAKFFNESALTSGIIIREADGRLRFVSGQSLDSQKREQATLELAISMGGYVDPEGAIFDINDFGSPKILDDPHSLPIQTLGMSCRMLDRRIVGSGWLSRPVDEPSSPPRIVFASLKGGVGRSTALAVAASDLAGRGQNVLVIDLDLEAPGLSDLLLEADQRPKFGVVDYLVESKIQQAGGLDISSFVELSKLTSGTTGRLDVVPAFGSTSSKYPQNVLPKLSRAMLETTVDDGASKDISTQLSEMIDRLSTYQQYDVILIDSRAGLAELTAPAVLGLGARVLLFGTSQQQTLVGYKAMFSGLKILAERDIIEGRSAAWRLMLKPVLAKSTLNEHSTNFYADGFYDLFSEYIYDEDFLEDTAVFRVNFPADDLNAPHMPLVIPFDPKFADFDPYRNQGHLTKPFYEQTFRPFFDALDALIEEARNVNTGAA